MIRSYSELSQLNTFRERFEYLKLDGVVAHSTFGSARYLNQVFYASDEWRKVRRRVILRDEGCDLGFPGIEISGRIFIHHIDPITPEDIELHSYKLVDMDNLICCSRQTHEAIHYGDFSLIPKDPIERHPGDTRLW